MVSASCSDSRCVVALWEPDCSLLVSGPNTSMLNVRLQEMNSSGNYRLTPRSLIVVSKETDSHVISSFRRWVIHHSSSLELST